MWRLSVCFALLATAAFAQEHHCVADDGSELQDPGLDVWENDKVSIGDFDVRVTSGYRVLTKKRQFIYCLENLRNSSVHFRWDGPAPTQLLSSKLGRPPNDRRTGKVKVHRDTVGQSGSGPRVLNLRRTELEDFEAFYVETYFEITHLGREEIIPAQSDPILPYASGEEFAAGIADLDGPLALSAGIILDVPRDAEDWPEFLEGGGEGEIEASRVMAELVLLYDRTTLEVAVQARLGFSPEFPTPDFERFFTSVRFSQENGFEIFGFEVPQDITPVFQGELQVVREGFIGIAETTPIGSLADFAQDGRALQRGNLPITVLLDGLPFAEFGLEVIGPPPSL